MLVDVDLVLDEFVLEGLLKVGAFGPELREVVHHVLHEMEAIEAILDAHVEGGCDGAFLYVAAHMEMAVGAAVGQPVDQRRVVSVRPCGCSLADCIFMRSTTLMTRIFSSGRRSRRIDTAARTSSVGVSPQQAMTTSGSLS
jgi:hypothetical protein